MYYQGLINTFREYLPVSEKTPVENAKVPLERLRKLIENTKFSFNGENIKVTVSIGVSSNINCDNAWNMFEVADKALYEAKGAGRNQVRSAVQ